VSKHNFQWESCDAVNGEASETCYLMQLQYPCKLGSGARYLAQSVRCLHTAGTEVLHYASDLHSRCSDHP
jgi:hypothetical protein